MRQYATFAVTIVATVALRAPALAQDAVPRIALAEAVARHAAHNLELRLARADAVARVGSARAAAPFPNPVASVTHEALSGQGREAGETYLTLSQEVVWPWVDGARRATVEQTRAAAQARVTADSLRLVFELKEAFVSAWLLEQRHEVTRRGADVFHRADASAAQRYAMGDLSSYDARRIRLERTRYERRLAASAIALGNARRALATLIAPDDTVTEMAPVGLPPAAIAAVEWARLERAVASHPTVVAAMTDRETARAHARAVTAARVPNPSLIAGYKSQRDALRGLFVGAALPLPLFNRNAGLVQAAEAGIEAMDARVSLARRAVQSDVRRAATRFELAARQLERVTAGDLDGIDALLDIGQTSYAEGELELLGLLDAATTFAELGAAVSEILAEYWISFFDLERALAAPLGGASGGELER